ncbi:MAG: zinc ABC transporter substrate-binding protein [Gemmatimonadaceae bacterium]|nr:zinc ABC transporter substrate-binding protein [Acetobacteraceae bacterium]
MQAKIVAAALLSILVSAATAYAQPAKPPAIVAAEAVYGDVAAQIAGPGIPVTSILNSANQDPHSFEASPSTARAVAAAPIVIYNGADYDPWMAKLVRANRSPTRQVFVVADLLGRRAPADPHFWYDPRTMPVVAKAIAGALAKADPAQAAAFAEREQAFNDALAPLDAKIAAMRDRFGATPITATEPVFGYMAAALGLIMRNERFQLAIMNHTEPRTSDVAAFEADLKARRVRVLIYNSQSTGPVAQRLLRQARTAGVPIVPVTETLPPGMTYQGWMLSQLDALEAALSAPP